MDDIRRGDVWYVRLGEGSGREVRGPRPALVVSVDKFNNGPAGLVVVIPVTSKKKGIPLHVEINPPEGGVKKQSFIKCEDLRSISRERLSNRLGRVSSQTVTQVEDRLRILLSL